jgi:HK97 family phage prohead protease
MNDIIIKHAAAIADMPQTNDARLSARFCITSEREDREGDVVLVSGADLSDHRRNPVVLANHDTKALVGKTESPDGLYTVESRPELKKMFATIHFQQANELGVQAYQLVRDGFLRATSIGFQIRKSTQRGTARTKGGRPPLLISEWSLAEISLVPVPMNPDAVMDTLHRSFDGKSLHPHLVKAIQPYAGESKVWVNGATLPIETVTTGMDYPGAWKLRLEGVEVAEGHGIYTTGGVLTANQVREMRGKSMPNETVQTIVVKADAFPDWLSAKAWLAEQGYEVADQPTATNDTGSRFDFYSASDIEDGTAFDVALSDKAIATFAVQKGGRPLTREEVRAREAYVHQEMQKVEETEAAQAEQAKEPEPKPEPEAEKSAARADIRTVYIGETKANVPAPVDAETLRAIVRAELESLGLTKAAKPEPPIEVEDGRLKLLGLELEVQHAKRGELLERVKKLEERITRNKGR